MNIDMQSTGTPDEPATSSALYRAVWRWHFYAGLICLPFLAMMAITGGLYLFSSEIDDVVYRDWLIVPPRSQAALPAQAVVDKALAAVPGTATRFVPPSGTERSAEVGVRSASGESMSVYVDPYEGRVLGRVADDGKLMNVIKHIHSLAIAGTVANHWIEIVAGWAIVLVVTGTYLWWPRGRSGGVVTVRGTPARRIWWRDLHAVTGAFAGVVILFLAVTGMPWSAFWGDQFGRLTNAWGIGLPEYLWDKVPQSTTPMSAQGTVPWTLNQAPVPLSHHPVTQAADAASAMTHEVAIAAKPIGLDAAVATFDRLGLPRGYGVNLPDGELGVYTATLFPADARQERVIHLDQYSGKPLIDVGYADYGVAGKASEWGISIHQGKQFGWVNQLVMLAGCVAIVVLAVSGTVAWWKRRPAGRLAVPVRNDGDKLARTVIAIAVVLGLIYPLLGTSMLVALAIEWLAPRAWRERIGA